MREEERRIRQDYHNKEKLKSILEEMKGWYNEGTSKYSELESVHYNSCWFFSHPELSCPQSCRKRLNLVWSKWRIAWNSWFQILKISVFLDWNHLRLKVSLIILCNHLDDRALQHQLWDKGHQRGNHLEENPAPHSAWMNQIHRTLISCQTKTNMLLMEILLIILSWCLLQREIWAQLHQHLEWLISHRLLMNLMMILVLRNSVEVQMMRRRNRAWLFKSMVWELRSTLSAYCCLNPALSGFKSQLITQTCWITWRILLVLLDANTCLLSINGLRLEFLLVMHMWIQIVLRYTFFIICSFLHSRYLQNAVENKLTLKKLLTLRMNWKKRGR